MDELYVLLSRLSDKDNRIIRQLHAILYRYLEKKRQEWFQPNELQGTRCEAGKSCDGRAGKILLEFPERYDGVAREC